MREPKSKYNGTKIPLLYNGTIEVYYIDVRYVLKKWICDDLL